MEPLLEVRPALTLDPERVRALMVPPLPVAEALGSSAALGRLREALARLVERPVHVTSPSPDAADHLRSVRWGLTYRGATAGAVTLDLAGCRALVDLIEIRHAGLRGVGELTAAEEGMLEFAALACVDELALGGALPDGVALERFAAGRELRDALSGAALEPCVFALSIGGRVGELVLWLPAEARARRAAFVEHDEAPSIDRVRVGLALEPLDISSAELDALAPGDVVLVGAANALAPGAPARLVTATGWSLCRAAVEFDSATSVRVVCREPDVQPLCSVGPRRPALLPVLGSRRLEAQELGELRAGLGIELSKPADGPARLVCSDGRTLAAEAVRHGAELGFRVLG